MGPAAVSMDDTLPQQSSPRVRRSRHSRHRGHKDDADGEVRQRTRRRAEPFGGTTDPSVVDVTQADFTRGVAALCNAFCRTGVPAEYEAFVNAAAALCEGAAQTAPLRLLQPPPRDVMSPHSSPRGDVSSVPSPLVISKSMSVNLDPPQTVKPTAHPVRPRVSDALTDHRSPAVVQRYLHAVRASVVKVGIDTAACGRGVRHRAAWEDAAAGAAGAADVRRIVGEFSAVADGANGPAGRHLGRASVAPVDFGVQATRRLYMQQAVQLSTAPPPPSLPSVPARALHFDPPPGAAAAAAAAPISRRSPPRRPRPQRSEAPDDTPPPPTDSDRLVASMVERRAAHVAARSPALYTAACGASGGGAIDVDGAIYALSVAKQEASAATVYHRVMPSMRKGKQRGALYNAPKARVFHPGSPPGLVASSKHFAIGSGAANAAAHRIASSVGRRPLAPLGARRGVSHTLEQVVASRCGDGGRVGPAQATLMQLLVSADDGLLPPAERAALEAVTVFR